MKSPVLDVSNARTVTWQADIRERHLDTLGHVNNVAYVRLFEEARWEMITAGGFGLAEVQTKGLSPVILDMNLRFRREVLNRETITIESCVVSYIGKIAKLGQVMKNQAGETACEAKFTFALFNLKTRHLQDPTPEWLAAIGLS
jgi:thioesterase-3